MAPTEVVLSENFSADAMGFWWENAMVAKWEKLWAVVKVSAPRVDKWVCQSAASKVA